MGLRGIGFPSIGYTDTNEALRRRDGISSGDHMEGEIHGINQGERDPLRGRDNGAEVKGGIRSPNNTGGRSRK